MVTVSVLQGLVFLFMASSLFAVSNSYCTSDFDCSFGQGCCNKKCVNSINCRGYSCSKDSDCGGTVALTCCRGTCEIEGLCKNANNEASHFWCIFGATFGGLIFV